MSTITDTSFATQRLKIKIETFTSTGAALSGQVDLDNIDFACLFDNDATSAPIAFGTLSGNKYTTPAGTNGHTYKALFIGR